MAELAIWRPAEARVWTGFLHELAIMVTDDPSHGVLNTDIAFTASEGLQVKILWNPGELIKFSAGERIKILQWWVVGRPRRRRGKVTFTIHTPTAATIREGGDRATFRVFAKELLPEVKNEVGQVIRPEKVDRARRIARTLKS